MSARILMLAYVIKLLSFAYHVAERPLRKRAKNLVRRETFNKQTYAISHKIGDRR